MLYLTVGYSKNVASNYSIFVSFNYNPSTAPLYLQIIKSQSKRAYNPQTKEWEIGWECFTNFISTLNDNHIPYDADGFRRSMDEFKKQLDNEQAITENKIEVDTSILDNVEFKTQPRDYQLEGIAYGLATKSMLLADEQGLGKSLQCLNIARLQKKGKHCLIIVGYDILQFNWLNEIMKHTNESGHLIGGQVVKKGLNKGKLRKGNMEERITDLISIDSVEDYFLVTSVATLRHSVKQQYVDKHGKVQKKKYYQIGQIIEELCQKGIIDTIIFDEGQVLKNYNSDQTQALLTIKSCDKKIIATGTPLTNNHIDLFPIMSWLGYEQSNYWCFREKYCVMGGYKNKDIIGNKNGKELNAKLKRFMLRRKKEDVLSLPDKIIIDEILDMDGKQEVLYNKTYALFKQELIHSKDVKKVLGLLINLRKITCHPTLLDESFKDSVKFERIHFLMKEIVENNGKAIIFTNWATPAQMLYKELSIYNPAMIIGATNDRMDQIDKFQNDDSCKVIIGTIGAMGTGITLTAANNVIFLDEPWNKSLKDQAIDRAHRIGSKRNINIYTLICRNTFDESVHNKVIKKGITFSNVVDGIDLDLLFKKFGIQNF